jgi:hypothetical protein
LYGLLGHQLIKAMYKSESIEILNNLMDGRTVTPLERYYQAADSAMRAGTLWVIGLFLAFIVVVRKPFGVALFVSSFFFFSLLLFCLFELSPSLVRLLNLDHIPYYELRHELIPDEVLVYKHRPFHSSKQIPHFKGDKYSPLYGVEVPSMIYESATTDEDGFAYSNSNGPSDVLVIGDSYMEFGLNKEDTFARRLERNSELRVANLSVGGYGPFQYLEVLKRYGIKRKPQYALFCFFEGNDLGDLRNYLTWKKTEHSRWRIPNGYLQTTTTSLSGSFLQRYLVALDQTSGFLKDMVFTGAQVIFNNNSADARGIHPDLAVLNLANKNYRVLFFYKNRSQPADEALNAEVWKELRNILLEFKATSAANSITPIIVYIPTAAHIYAEYSTDESGENWLRRRQEQVAAKANTEKAMSTLAKEINLELISLTPTFEASAAEGKLLYYPFDSHWNSEGREVAAVHVAQSLKKLSTSARGRANR